MTLTPGYLILKTMADHFDDSSTQRCSQSALHIALKLTKTAGFRRNTQLYEVAHYLLTEKVLLMTR